MSPAEVRHRKRRRARVFRWSMAILLLLVLVSVSGYQGNIHLQKALHERLISSPEYQQVHGRWDKVVLPKDQQVNAIHSAMLPTGKVLLIAGSGNDEDRFEAGTFNTLVYDPVTGTAKTVPTPADVFCAGHAFLANGNLLVAGGTGKYEVLADKVTHAGGAITIRNENPNIPQEIPKGTHFFGEKSGKRYVTDFPVTLPPAEKIMVTRSQAKITASEVTVFASAVERGEAGVYLEPDHMIAEELRGTPEERNVYGLSAKMTLDKQNYTGLSDSFEFNPWTEQYERVGNMRYPRWYPTLTSMPDGSVVAVSGLDGSGEIVQGHTEVYDPVKRRWVERRDLRQHFKTYASLFQTKVRDRMFFSGSSTGYGPAEQGRDPFFWNLKTNTTKVVPGIRDVDMLETSASGWAGPVNNQRLMVVGGGGVGESPLSTGRIDFVDLDEENPHFTPGPSLPDPTRYPNLVTLPNDDTLITGGSREYRGKSKSDIKKAYILGGKDATLRPVADPTIGRNYHASAVLLPTGQVMTTGSDPLFKDAENRKPGAFENTIEIFTPPYLLPQNGQPVVRPTITGGPDTVKRGGEYSFTIGTDSAVPQGAAPGAPDPARTITKARMILPAAVTHVTDTNQRSVAVGITQEGDNLKVKLPGEATLMPSGWYMLFVNGDNGTHSLAKWVRVE
ncbi:DUF1929 domain-containing protein [Candidatus Saccharibacteria bacterium]|nr:DUF1929 domain-containing protein [Candidatus Saccharibacteria bacterium]